MAQLDRRVGLLFFLDSFPLKRLEPIAVVLGILLRRARRAEWGRPLLELKEDAETASRLRRLLTKASGLR